MANKRRDITNQTFGKLTAIEFSHVEKNIRFWKFQCSCTNIVIRNPHNITKETAATQSCGCHRKVASAKNLYKHGHSQTPEYMAWSGMHRRCSDINYDHYERYGGRGISVCEQWCGLVGLEKFLEDMGKRPEGMSLERKDANVGYSPENCIWTTKSEQSFNQNTHKNNTSGRTGVIWHSRDEVWAATIACKKERIHLGYFLNYLEAVAARERAELKYFGRIKGY